MLKTKTKIRFIRKIRRFLLKRLGHCLSGRGVSVDEDDGRIHRSDTQEIVVGL